ncbi:MAG: oligopeptide/dipeptide ABC transporter ATP-binding protein [Acidobacteriota bacterium]|nr:oligopeptide/dipeptide ABC transporter ATP-binding protein [Acidobacteriota bacterium]
MSVLVETRGLSKHFPIRRGILQRHRGEVRALDGVDLEIRRGECFALVGESGSGKTTLGRCLVRLIEPTAGSISFDGEDLLALSGESLRRHRRRFQMIFQDPYGSLNPRMRVQRILAEPLAVHGIVERSRRAERIGELLDTVGLPQQAMERFPHEFSGGQRQRIGIARALATEPDFLIADEPVSALDVSVRAQIVNLLYHLQQRLGLTLLFIGHDLALVEQIADRVAVLYLGRVVEEAECSELFRRPLHPYTVSLLSAVPVADPNSRRRRIVLRGDPPSPASPPGGCPFHPRCPIARPHCAQDDPPLVDTGDGRRVACHYAGELTVGDPVAAP